MTDGTGTGGQQGGAAGQQGGQQQQQQQAAWHTGLEADYVGLLQNRGVKLDDPKDAVVNLAKALREHEKYRGAPAEQIVRLPQPDTPEAEKKAFWQRLGAPADPKDYDFSSVKYADGEPIEQSFADALRATLGRLGAPKEWGVEIAKDLAKFADGDQATITAERTARTQAERAELQKEWKADFDGNLFIAKRGAQALGLTPEQVNELENVTGYSAIMKAMHKVGVLNREDGFVGGDLNRGMMTREQATARISALKDDKLWVDRYMKGDTAARAELLNLQRIQTGTFDTAA